MKKSSRNWLVAAAVLICLGVILFGMVFALTGCEKLKPEKLAVNTYVPEGEFTNMSFEVDISDVELVLSDDGSFRVECNESENAKHEVNITEGTLTVRMHEKDLKWYDKLINAGRWLTERPKVTVYLPKAELNDITVESDTGKLIIPDGLTFNRVDIMGDTGSAKIGAITASQVNVVLDTGAMTITGAEVERLGVKADTGSVKLVNIKAGPVEASNDTGAIVLENIDCASLSAECDTGAIKLTNVNCEGDMLVENDTGSIKFENCKAASIEATNDTGSISGTLACEMVFDAKSSTGSVNVPDSTAGGSCKLRTTTGSIKIEYSEGA